MFLEQELQLSHVAALRLHELQKQLCQLLHLSLKHADRLRRTHWMCILEAGKRRSKLLRMRIVLLGRKCLELLKRQRVCRSRCRVGK
jgi:hypothetical protein